VSEELNSGSQLTADAMTAAFQSLSDQLGRKGVTGEICIFGGAVMVLAFQARTSTKDVDAIFQPTQEIREAARTVAREQNLPEDWLNDGVKGFISKSPPVTERGLPQFSNLHIVMPAPEYLLAMKCLAGRIGREGVSDVPDIVFLIRRLGLKSSKEVLDIVSDYYGSGVPVKTQYLIEGFFSEGVV
jgi:hypothetical protein